ncbi:DcaP family trimeric outer membrane transporter, partial [Alcanivorax sp.]|uniref:DcaP family trimeric outer membrane transporter n=1 Tax=Alcanivorax sp. TaxID=1872427 RepID=UPI000C5F076E
LDFIAKQSRFWLKSETMTSAGMVRGHIEIDFQTNDIGDERISNSYAPRIRHAYLTWDKWLFGQTWSTFFNVSALPETLDFVGAAGTVFERQPQIRYTSGGLMLAVENPSTTLYGGAQNPYDDNAMPDLVARYNIAGDWGNVSVSAMGRELAYQDTIGGVDQDESEYGYGLSLAGRMMLGAMDDIRFQANYGNALGRYTTLNAFRSGQIEADGSIELIDQWSGVLALRHHWSDRWRSNFAVSVSEADNPDTVAVTTSKRVQSAHANLIWQVAKPLSLGGELIYADREIENGDDGNLKRVQFTAKYAF